MPTRIKNCGLTTPASVTQACATGASFVGFVHHAASPRHLPIRDIAPLYAHVAPTVAKVIVLVSPADALLDELPKPDFWQIHGVVDASRIHAIHARTGIPVITAISVRNADDLTTVPALEDASSHLLFDAPHAGSGHRFDWQLLTALMLSKPWFLAGGLTVETVAAAIRATGAPMVDVSSGIERAVGIKSEELIAAFNAAVLHAAHG